MKDLHSLWLVMVMAAVTAAIRFAPFAVFRSAEATPKSVTRLGSQLPRAVMGMLVVYCLRNTSPAVPPHALPEAAACAVTALLFLWRRNTLLSILAGTVCYMLLIQMVF